MISRGLDGLKEVHHVQVLGPRELKARDMRPVPATTHNVFPCSVLSTPPWRIL